jgi:uncharacterized protein (DUF1697 family)
VDAVTRPVGRRRSHVASQADLSQVMEEPVQPPRAAWHVGFVRSIMHGRDGVTADVLRDEARRAGADTVATYHSTGNVIFRAEDGAAVCEHLTRVLSPLVERDTTVVHRTAGDVAALVRADPFAAAPLNAAELIVVFSSVPLDTDEIRSVLPKGLGLLDVHSAADAAFWRADRAGPHPHPVIERLTGAPATARSISTIEGVDSRLRASAAC